jgi:hypothetical protein
VLALGASGMHTGTTAGRPALVSQYRYPEDPTGVGVTAVLRGPETLYRIRIPRRVANFGVVVTSQARGTRVEPRVVAGVDENRLTGYAGLPLARNPYLDNFQEPVLVAGALSPLPGEYTIVFDSARRAGAGRFTFRSWVDDVTPPRLRLRSSVVDEGQPVLVSASDSGAGVYPGLVPARLDGRSVRATYRGGVVSVPTNGLDPGAHRLRLQVSDYQELKNTENVVGVLPNTRILTATITIRP